MELDFPAPHHRGLALGTALDPHGAEWTAAEHRVGWLDRVRLRLRLRRTYLYSRLTVEITLVGHAVGSVLGNDRDSYGTLVL